MSIQKLVPQVHDKVWGSPLTEPWFSNPAGPGGERKKIGEIWFSAPESLPVLVKLLFTTDRLSVQVHPDDLYAQAHGLRCGKTEMWHILRAEPDATIAFGLRQAVTKEVIRTSAISGEIIDLLHWIPVRAGETFFTPAGTIHAIGGGLAICEVQQLSDVTYRLFDYHREPPRPLHIEESLAVARLEPAVGHCDAQPCGKDREILAECEYFRAERLSVSRTARSVPSGRPAIFIAIAGEGTIAGAPFRAGEAWLVPLGTPAFSINSPDAAFIIASQG